MPKYTNDIWMLSFSMDGMFKSLLKTGKILDGRYKKAVFALFAVAIAIGTTWQASRTAVPKPATWDEIVAEAGAGGYGLINTDNAAGRVNRKMAHKRDRLFADAGSRPA